MKKGLRRLAFAQAVLLCLALLASCQRSASGPAAFSAGRPVFLPPRPGVSAARPAAPKPEPPLEPPDETEPVSDLSPSEPEPEPTQRRNNRLYILMYHELALEGQPCNTWTITNTRFREDIQWLSDNGYTTVLPGELAAGIPLLDKAVMITFDDGYCSNYWVAYPILQEFQSKAAIAVIASKVEGEEPYFLNWAMCREMVQSGLVELGSHTYLLHDDPLGVRRHEGESREDYEARVFPDLQASIDLIEANVGVRPRFFAYPYGKTDAWVTDFIRDNFDVSVTTHHASADLSRGLYGMDRLTVTMDSPLCTLLP